MIRTPLIKKRVSALHAAVGALAPPLDVAAVADHLGLDIERVGRLDRGARAQYRPRFARIDVLDSLSEAAQRFAVAHEVGHVDLGHGERSCYLDFIAEFAPLDEIDSGPDYEAEANQFAGRLLVPRHWLLRALDGEPSLEDLRRQFGVSKEVAVIAIERERLLNRLPLGR